jgi:putative transposase
MKDKNSLTHSVLVCKYHVVWTPKHRKKKLYGDIAKYLGETFRELARQRESRIVEGHISCFRDEGYQISL